MANSQQQTWLECSVAVDQEAAEAVSEVLARYGYQGGVVIDPPWEPTVESDGWVGTPGPDVPSPPVYTTDPSRPVVLRTYLPMDEQTEDTRQRLEQSLWHLGQLRPVGPLQVRVLEEQDWANEWKQHYHVQHIGERVVIVPSWLDYAPRPHEVVLLLDPGMAFGTGLHPTTRLCLLLLERVVQPGQTVFDVGTGSGILAIAAAKLGSGAVLAIDNDPVAVEVARENMQRNGVADVVTVALGSPGSGAAFCAGANGEASENCEHEQGFDLIVANIIASVLVALAHDLAATLAPGGVLLCSGIIQEREEEVAQALAAAGLTQHERRSEGDWVALVCSR